MLLDQSQLEKKIEALIFASQEPISLSDVQTLVDPGEEFYSRSQFQKALENLEIYWNHADRSFCLTRHMDGGFFFIVRESYFDLMERLFTQKPRPLSRAAQETLSIIAYRQPVTRADIEFIRGVDAGTIIKNLLERNLIQCVGRKEDAGRPMIFATTDEFLRVYNLRTLADLPPLESFQPSLSKIQSAMEKLDDIEGEIAEKTVSTIEKNMV